MVVPVRMLDFCSFMNQDRCDTLFHTSRFALAVLISDGRSILSWYSASCQAWLQRQELHSCKCERHADMPNNDRSFILDGIIEVGWSSFSRAETLDDNQTVHHQLQLPRAPNLWISLGDEIRTFNIAGRPAIGMGMKTKPKVPYGSPGFLPDG